MFLYFVMYFGFLYTFIHTCMHVYIYNLDKSPDASSLRFSHAPLLARLPNNTLVCTLYNDTRMVACWTIISALFSSPVLDPTGSAVVQASVARNERDGRARQCSTHQLCRTCDGSA